jgi:hypothetical protein
VAAARPLHVHFNRKSLTESLEKKFLNREREKRAHAIKKRISEANKKITKPVTTTLLAGVGE